MQIAPLAAENPPAALAYLGARCRIARATALERHAAARRERRAGGRGAAAIGVAFDLPRSADRQSDVRADTGVAVGALLAGLADRDPRLRAGPAWALLPADRHTQRCAARRARVGSRSSTRWWSSPSGCARTPGTPAPAWAGRRATDGAALADVAPAPDRLRLCSALVPAQLPAALSAGKAGGHGRHALRHRRDRRDRP